MNLYGRLGNRKNDLPASTTGRQLESDAYSTISVLPTVKPPIKTLKAVQCSGIDDARGAQT